MIVVTGAAGFLGSDTVWALNQRGDTDILCLDRRPTDRDSANLAPLRYAGYQDHETFLAAMRRGDHAGRLRGVIHLGACINTTLTDWDYLQRNTARRGVRFRRWCRGILAARCAAAPTES